jgi:hypothetical protein
MYEEEGHRNQVLGCNNVQGIVDRSLGTMTRIVWPENSVNPDFYYVVKPSDEEVGALSVFPLWPGGCYLGELDFDHNLIEFDDCIVQG